MSIQSSNIINISSLIIYFLLILIILVRSPNEQSLQENLSSFQFFESSSKAERSIDRILILLTFFYFFFGVFFNFKNIL